MSGSRQGYSGITIKPAKGHGKMYQVTVTTSPTLIAQSNGYRIDILIYNSSTTQTVYLDLSPNVDLTKFPLKPEVGLSFDDYTGDIYGVVQTGTAVVGVIEI
jgi:hypothetical protein